MTRRYESDPFAPLGVERSLTPTARLLLAALRDAGGRLTVRRLAFLTGTPTPDAFRAVRQLKRDGFCRVDGIGESKVVRVLAEHLPPTPAQKIPGQEAA